MARREKEKDEGAPEGGAAGATSTTRVSTSTPALAQMTSRSAEPIRIAPAGATGLMTGPADGQTAVTVWPSCVIVYACCSPPAPSARRCMVTEVTAASSVNVRPGMPGSATGRPPTGVGAGGAGGTGGAGAGAGGGAARAGADASSASSTCVCSRSSPRRGVATGSPVGTGIGGRPISARISSRIR